MMIRDSFKKCIKIFDILMVLLVIPYFGLAVNQNKRYICSHEDCIETARDIKQNMDPSVNPCNDFYKYACGKYSENPKIGGALTLFDEVFIKHMEKIVISLENEYTNIGAIKKAQKLYNSCMNIDAIEVRGMQPIYTLLFNLGLPKLPSLITGKKPIDNPIKMAAKIYRTLGINDIFELKIIRDVGKRYNHIFLLNLRASNIEPVRLVNPWNLWDVKDLYPVVKEMSNHSYTQIEYVKKMIGILDKQRQADYLGKLRRTLKHFINDQYQEDPKKLDEYERAINNATLEMFSFFNATMKNILEIPKSSNEMLTIDVLEKDTSDYIKRNHGKEPRRRIWKPFLEELINDIGNYNFSKNEVLAMNIESLKNVALIVNNSTGVVLEAILWWSVVKTVIPKSPKALQLVYQNDENISANRSLACANIVNNHMSYAVARMIIMSESIFEGQKRRDIDKMIQYLKDSLDDTINNLDYASDITRFGMYLKNSNMKIYIGHPHWLTYDWKLDEMYNVTIEDNYFENVDKLHENELKKSLELVIKGVDENKDPREGWVEPLTATSPRYRYEENSLYVPLSMAEKPFFGYPLEVMNYGTLGYFIGHEIVHGYDLYGGYFNWNGELKVDYVNKYKTQEIYKSKASCYNRQYNNFVVDLGGCQVNISGSISQRENIADNLGLQLAYDAYQKRVRASNYEETLPGFENLSANQLFFLAYSQMYCEALIGDLLKMYLLQDVHTLGRFRVNAPLQNSKSFSEAWKCPSGSYMNPSKKCRMWG